MAKIGYKKNATELSFNDSDGTSYINGCRFKYAILEKIDEIVFDNFKNIDVNNLTCWEKGRLFGGKTELKWQKRHGKFHLVIITEECGLPSLVDIHREDLEPFLGKDGRPIYRSIYLWGIKEFQKDVETYKNIPQNQWYEPRIPQLLQYPVNNYRTQRKRVKIKVQEYKLREKDGQDNELTSIIHRFVDVMEV